MISQNQCGFVKGRQISDNILLAEELMTSINKKVRGSNAVLKLDMAKAFDRVSWPFLMSILRAFGFGEQWIDRIWRLVSSNHFSLLINGESKGFFNSSRGLRQGDPLSPSLFIISAELFSRALNLLLDSATFSPFSVPRGCPSISHLNYADDIIIFCTGLKKSLAAVMNVINVYERCSGQKVNSQKSCYMVGNKTPNSRKEIIKRLTGFPQKSSPLQYLGCPIFIGRKTKYLFNELVDSIKLRINS